MSQTIITSFKHIKTRSPIPYKPTIYLAIIAAFPFFLLGYDVPTWMASGTIAKDLGLTGDQIDFFVTTASWGALAGGALVAGVAANFVGRKYTAAFGGAVYTVGALFVAFAHGYTVALCGRALAGFGTGMGLLVGPIYIAEIAPANVRSFLGHFPQVMMAVGMLTAYTLRAAFVRLHPHTAWRVIVGLSVLPCFASTILACYLPDSPCWLVMMGKVDVAQQLLVDCRGIKNDDDDDDDDEEEDDNEVEARMMQLKKIAGFDLYCEGNQVSGAPRRIIGFRALFEDTFNGDLIIRPIFRTVILLAGQEAICEELVFQTLGASLEWNGLGCCLPSSVAGVLLAAIKLLSTSLSACWANGLGGRKVLLILSTLLAACSLGAVGTTVFADAHDRIGHGTAFALYSVETVVLLMAVGFGVGPYPWMFGPEAFPLPARAPCIGLCIVLKYAFRYILSEAFPIFYGPFEEIWGVFIVVSGLQIVCFVLYCIFIRDFTSQILVDRVD